MSDQNASIDFMNASGMGSGDVAGALIQNDFDLGCLRPVYDADSKQSYAIVNNERRVITNAPASLRKDAWIELDTAIVESARQRLKLVGDLTSSGLVYNLPNGFSKSVLETETVGDIEDAEISMDPANSNKADGLQFDLTTLPLPIVHKGFHYTARQIASNQSSGTPLDTTHARLAARRVAERIEKMTIGLETYQYGGGNVYGLLNFPGRVTTTFSDPSLTTGWNGSVLVSELLAMKQLLKGQLHYGPFAVYFGTEWDRYLDEDYSSAKGSNTIRERIGQISQIDSIETLDFLPGYTCLMVQKSSDVIRMVNGINMQTIQWPSMGGLKVNFKVMAMMVPQVRQDFYSRCGVLHATAQDNS